MITQLSVAFGPTFPSLGNGSVTFWLLNDPDMDPRYPTHLVRIQTIPDVTNDAFFSVEIPPTKVSGAFFVGERAQLAGRQDRPLRVDTDASGDKSLFFYDPNMASVIDNLAGAAYSTRMDNTAAVSYLGAFMIRASGKSVGK